MKKLTRDRVVAYHLGEGLLTDLGNYESRVRLPCRSERIATAEIRASLFSLELNSWSNQIRFVFECSAPNKIRRKHLLTIYSSR